MLGFQLGLGLGFELELVLGLGLGLVLGLEFGVRVGVWVRFMFWVRVPKGRTRHLQLDSRAIDLCIT